MTDKTRTRSILPAPACDLLDRLTAELDIQFTLTDPSGTVVASTAGDLAGSLDPNAAVSARALSQRGHSVPDHGPRVYVPLMLAGTRAGTLIAYGRSSEVEAPAHVAAVSVGLALDFVDAALAVGQEEIHPGWLLYRLLRGSAGEAAQARIMASIVGWQLFVQRVALVVQVRPKAPAAAPSAAELDAAFAAALKDRSVPFGAIGDGGWAFLLHHEPEWPWGRIREVAERLQTAANRLGYAAGVGIGEPHLPVQPVTALRRSFREAMFALRLGMQMRGGEPGIFELRSLGPAGFFAPSSPSRRRLASLVLDPIAGDNGLMVTLNTYLSSNLSVSATAAALQLHRHTVRNHLERIAQLTGLDPRELEGAVQLKLAMLVAAADPDVWDEENG